MVNISEAIKTNLNFNGISDVNSKGEANYDIRITETENFYIVKIIFLCRNTNKRINITINSLIDYFDVPEGHLDMPIDKEYYRIRDKKYFPTWGVEFKLAKN